MFFHRYLFFIFINLCSIQASVFKKKVTVSHWAFNIFYIVMYVLDQFLNPLQQSCEISAISSLCIRQLSHRVYVTCQNHDYWSLVYCAEVWVHADHVHPLCCLWGSCIATCAIIGCGYTESSLKMHFISDLLNENMSWMRKILSPTGFHQKKKPLQIYLFSN